MKGKLRLGRLLSRKVISELLSHFTSLLEPDSVVGLWDSRGRHLGSTLEVDWPRIWDRIRSLEVYRDHDGNLVAWPIVLDGEPVGVLAIYSQRSTECEPVAQALVAALELVASEAAARRAIAQETLDRYREVNVLYDIGETLGACLELDEVCRLVLSESMKLINCRRGAVLLRDQDEQANNETSVELVLAEGVGVNNLRHDAMQEGLQLITQVVVTGKPQIVNDFQPAGMPRTPVVCAPLRFREEVLGAIFLADKAQSADFSAADEKLLLALATQAASSIKNARLFESVKQQRDEIAQIKSFLDNIFASIASGVITTDMNDLITSFNRAAETILDRHSTQVLNRPYQTALDFLNDTLLPGLVRDVQQNDQTFIDFEINPEVPTRGPIYLNVSLSRLRGAAETPLGVTIVVDDVTEKKKFERERRMVRRYLPAQLVDSLPDNLDELKLRGERQIITTLFADIRGFTSFSEAHNPEMVVQAINSYFDLATQAVGDHHGIVDKYLGDAVMALFNPPLLARESHAWDAIQAAWQLKQAIEHYHQKIMPNRRLSIGMGICTGEAVVGNVGTIDRMEYTAIGDAVNVAKRLQENAAAGQILMSHSTWEIVKDRVQARPLPPVTLKGRRTSTQFFELTALNE